MHKKSIVATILVVFFVMGVNSSAFSAVGGQSSWGTMVWDSGTWDEDSDNDKMPDSWESDTTNNNLNVGTDDSASDKDGDGLKNLEEYQIGTYAFNTDSDGDGYSDYDEYQAGTNPLDSHDAPGGAWKAIIPYILNQ